MERPYKDRATFQDNFTDLKIIIPAKRNWFIILFIGTLLGGWLMGEIFALNGQKELVRSRAENLFI